MQEYKLQLKVENTKLICSILGDIQECDFAFYLKVNNEKINERWYDSKNSCIFLVPEENYKVIGFVKKKNGEVIALHSKLYEGVKRSEIRELQFYSVSIFGSCVSRDIFEFQKENIFQLKKYYARCSIVSAVSQPFLVEEEKIVLESNFQRRQVLADLNKKMWSELQQDKSDYLIVDFVDERFQLGKIGEKYFTLSNEMLQSEYIKEYSLIERKKKKQSYICLWQKKNKNVYYVDNKSLAEWLDIFWDKVLQIYPAEKIILHEVKLADYYYDNNGNLQKFDENNLKYNMRFNQLMEYMYDYSKNRLKNCIYISIEDSRYASSKHKWGLAPMHYVDDYYNKVLEMISKKIKE